MSSKNVRTGTTAVFAGVLMALASISAQAAIEGISGTTFNFTARIDHISTADGGSVLLWGLADDAGSNNGRAQYPAPTLIVNQGDTITVNLSNSLTVAAGDVPNVSLVFPGHDVTATCTTPGTSSRRRSRPPTSGSTPSSRARSSGSSFRRSPRRGARSSSGSSRSGARPPRSPCGTSAATRTAMPSRAEGRRSDRGRPPQHQGRDPGADQGSRVQDRGDPEAEDPGIPLVCDERKGPD